VLNGKRVVVVMPAYNAARTLRWTYDEIPRDVVDDVLLVDDASHDETVTIAAELGLRYLVHDRNRGYGANQKTCYRLALALGADVVVMLHADYQYTPRLISAMAAMIASGVYPVVLGSRMLGRGALAGGMPLYKFISNRTLTLIQNVCFRRRLTEYHTGYRAFAREVLLRLPLEEISDGFIFDNEILAQLIAFEYEIAEITCPARYFKEASSTGVWRSTLYGLGVLRTTYRYLLHALGWRTHRMFNERGKKLDVVVSAQAASGPRVVWRDQ
jgi:glycosyltransferase involved in cell wall biosynthesis